MMDHSQRIVLQRLESLRRAGVRGLSRSLMPIVTSSPVAPAAGNQVDREASPSPERSATTAETSAPPARDLPPTATGEPSRISPTSLPGRSVPDDPSSRPFLPSSSAESTPVPRTVPVPAETASLTPEDRRDALATVCAIVKDCRRCPQLAEERTQTVFGVGNPDARILFLGEAPGADEDRQGEPFVGRSGKLMNDIIKASKLTREEIYICNVIKCRPPGNRNPNGEEASNCREYLDAQIAIVNPEYIVCWGKVAASNLLGDDTPIGRLRGKFHKHGSAKVLCTYHPSYLLRNPPAKRDVWDDMKFLMRDMGVEL